MLPIQIMWKGLFDMRHRILYIMNVDWDWLKQRPHFIAQHLSSTQDVIVIYPYSWRRRNLSQNDRSGLKIHPFFRLPFSGRFSWIRNLNIFISRKMAGVFLRWYRPDFIWISSPELFEYLPKPTSVPLVYDCMDDVLEFPSNAARRSSLAISEKELIAASFLVFCSSKNLCDKLVVRSRQAKKCVVSYNAFESSAAWSVSEKKESKMRRDRYVLGYFGTISSWLDFEALFKIVNEFPSVEIHLIGPIENLGVPFPQHERIKWLGIVLHDDLQTYTREFDALMMPFQVPELIQAVDPVKLYEYIFFDKPIVSVMYSEIERFSDFVDFYTNYDELIAIINNYLSEGFRKKYLNKTREQFLFNNTWAHRVDFIEKKLADHKLARIID